MASKRCGKNLLKAVLFTCLVSHLTRADYKESIFQRLTIGLEGCENITKQRQNMDLASLAMMCQFDDNCSAFQYNQFTGEYQSCDRYKVSSLSMDGRSYWVKRTPNQCIKNKRDYGGFTLKKPLQVGDLVSLSFTPVVASSRLQVTFREQPYSDYIYLMQMILLVTTNSNSTIVHSKYNSTSGRYLTVPSYLPIGETHSLYILLTLETFIILLNGQKWLDYPYEFPLDSVTYLEAAGPIQIHDFCV